MNLRHQLTPDSENHRTADLKPSAPDPNSSTHPVI